MADLTPAQRRKIAKLAKDFKKSMEQLGLGVSIKAGDGPWVEVTPPPDGSPPEGSE
jgi:hypothetical protein